MGEGEGKTLGLVTNVTSGDVTNWRRLFAGAGNFECNRDFATSIGGLSVLASARKSCGRERRINS